MLLVTLAAAMAFAGCSAQPAAEERDRALTSLGKEIFHDATLSVDGSVSCASCHQPSRQFTDGRVTSIGAHGAIGTRNAPSLLDVPLVSTFFWDGRDTRLSDVVLQPFTNTVEMGLPDHDALMKLIAGKPEYQRLVKNAFGDGTASTDRIAHALVAYLQALPVSSTRFDLYTQSNDATGLSDDEIAGLALFKGKAACADCHSLGGSPATLTDNGFHHAGISFDSVAGTITDMVGRLDAIEQQAHPVGQAILTDADIAGLGRFAITRKPGDLGAFRTPSLRNVTLTAPYMHDGSVATLEQAVEREIYYRSLALGRPISLTVEEQSQLVAFLSALNAEQPTLAAGVDSAFRAAPTPQPADR